MEWVRQPRLQHDGRAHFGCDNEAHASSYQRLLRLPFEGLSSIVHHTTSGEQPRSETSCRGAGAHSSHWRAIVGHPRGASISQQEHHLAREALRDSILQRQHPPCHRHQEGPGTCLDEFGLHLPWKVRLQRHVERHTTIVHWKRRCETKGPQEGCHQDPAASPLDSEMQGIRSLFQASHLGKEPQRLEGSGPMPRGSTREDGIEGEA
mmetsp:Transcript_4155/g.11723  ORF Transcript_4155/g.11723 Transcript_4155/m.11723 type:complete len:207 (-) Transcript_4155:399-1019(-)